MFNKCLYTPNVINPSFFCYETLQQSQRTLIEISDIIIKMGLIYEICNKGIGDFLIELTANLTSQQF